MLPDGQMSRVVRESNLVPSKPAELSEILILPSPCRLYKQNMDSSSILIFTVPSMLHAHLSRLDIKHKITSVKGFAAHLDGTVPLTPALLQTQPHNFTVWYYLTIEHGRFLCIEVGQELGFANQEFGDAKESNRMAPMYGSDQE